MGASAEILEILAGHGEQTPIGYGAIFTLLNTVAGGHYLERYGEGEIQAALAEMLTAGAIEARDELGERRQEIEWPNMSISFHITPAGRSRLYGGAGRP